MIKILVVSVRSTLCSVKRIGRNRYFRENQRQKDHLVIVYVCKTRARFLNIYLPLPDWVKCYQKNIVFENFDG